MRLVEPELRPLVLASDPFSAQAWRPRISQALHSPLLTAVAAGTGCPGQPSPYYRDSPSLDTEVSLPHTASSVQEANWQREPLRRRDQQSRCGSSLMSPHGLELKPFPCLHLKSSLTLGGRPSSASASLQVPPSLNSCFGFHTMDRDSGSVRQTPFIPKSLLAMAGHHSNNVPAHW